MWDCRAENAKGGPSEVGSCHDGVTKAVAGECERPAAAKGASIRRALVGAAEGCGERNRDRGRYVLQGCGEKGGLERVDRSEEHTSELQSRQYLVCRLLLEKNN